MAETDQAVHFLLDGRPSEGRVGEVIISAAERAGVYIPRFCYHPRMKPVGMCRMCLVEVSGPRGATLQPSCFVHVAEGMEVTTTSEKVRKAQEGVLEFLLVNHPLDCPVCDKGGECPLQDQALSHGPGESRFIEEKRHFEKPVAISDLVLLDRERCIQCARCTRFAEEIAGEAQIDFAGRGERVEVATFPGRPFTSYFSGNTVQICPVGALTATPYRFAARPWDLDQVESTCTACALGCRVALQSSANRITRLLGLDSDPVNQTWLCDKGRFVFESVNGTGETAPQRAVRVSIGRAVDLHAARVERVEDAGEDSPPAFEGRLTQPLVRKDGELVPASWGEALGAAALGLSSALEAGGPSAVALLGGARCTNEGAYAWTKFMKGVLQSDSVDAQLGDGLPGELVLSLPTASIDDACRARVVVLLTGDVREELPVLFLRLRGAVLAGKTQVLEISQMETSLTPYAALSLRARPGDAVAICEALADPDATGAHRLLGATTVSEDELARARGLLGAPSDGVPGDGVVVVAGRQSLAEHAGVTSAALRHLAAGLPGTRFLPALRRGNVRGALSLGMSPGLMPGGVSLDAARAWFEHAWGSVPERTGRSAEGVLRSLAGDAPDASDEQPVRALVLVGADPLVDMTDHDLARRAFHAAPFVIAVAGHRGPSSMSADVVLPVAVEHERPGTTTNVEGRVTRLGQKIVPPGEVWPDWVIAAELALELGKDMGFGSLGDVAAEMERLAPLFRGLTDAELSALHARDGLVVPVDPDAPAGDGVLPVDPMVTPGVSSADLQGSPFTVGLTHPVSADLPSLAELALIPAQPDGTPARPLPRAGLGALVGALLTPHVPAEDRYSLRLVASRRLYDSGTAVTWSPSLERLVADARLRVNPGDLERLGVSSGETVHVTSPRGALDLPCDEDGALPSGSVAIDFGVPLRAAGIENAASVLIDAGAAVTEVRLETVG